MDRKRMGLKAFERTAKVLRFPSTRGPLGTRLNKNSSSPLLSGQPKAACLAFRNKTILSTDDSRS